MRHGRPDHLAAAVARSQHGLLHRSDAAAAGLTARMIRTRVENGRLEWVSARVLRVAGAPGSWGQDLAIAVMTAGVDSCASHRSAALLHGLETFGTRSRRFVEVTVSKARHISAIPGIVHVSEDLGPTDITVADGIRCTTVARTLADLGAVIRTSRLEHAVDGALRDGTTTIGELHNVLTRVRRRGRNGVVALETVLDRCGEARPQSVLERRFLRLLGRADLPPPQTQVHVRRPDGPDAYLDFAYPRHRLAIEVDGHGTHSTRAQRAADAQRANQLALVGWTVLRFTYDDVRARSSEVAATVRRALATSPDVP